MSLVQLQKSGQQMNPTTTEIAPPRLWIMNPWADLLLFISTPLLIVPVVFILDSPFVGIESATIAMVVTAFFALGHHLPGMIRAYGDRELFERFHLRFILAPLILFAVCVPLYRSHFEVFELTIYFWGCWHGLMQLYGFVRIYDAKVGSTSPVTAYWDWLMCLTWFPTALVFSHKKTAVLLAFWYSFGGPVIPSWAVPVFRWASLAVSTFVLIGFLVNYGIQSRKGPAPNPLKLLMLSSGIGFWWFAFVYVGNAVIGVTLNEIAHDVQYMAITWLYNCRRVKSNARLDGFMAFVFKRGMVLLYVSLIAAYGAIGLVPSLVNDGTIKGFFNGFVMVSTILHYYYDGFIWKVREKSTQVALGVSNTANMSLAAQMGCGGSAHVMKWSPLILFVGWLVFADFTEPSLSPERIEELKSLYQRQLSSTTTLPKSEGEQSWLYAQFEQAQRVAAAVPEDRDAVLRAAIMLANFGRNDEAVAMLQSLLKQDDKYAEGYLTLGSIQLYRGNLDQAESFLNAALTNATTKKDRSNSNLKLGELYARRNDFVAAKSKFEAAVKDSPKLQESIDTLRKNNEKSYVQ